MFEWICRVRLKIEGEKHDPVVVTAWTRKGAARKAAIKATRAKGRELFRILKFDVTVQRGAVESSWEIAQKFAVYVECKVTASVIDDGR